MGLPEGASSQRRVLWVPLSLSSFPSSHLFLSRCSFNLSLAGCQASQACLVLSWFAFKHLQSKPAGCLAAVWLVENAWARELLCLDVLGGVVGGQLLVALKVGGTCFD